MVYFKEEDILHLSISEEPESESMELNPNITVELNDKGELIDIEIINASSYIRDFILASVQGKLLNLPDKKPVAKGYNQSSAPKVGCVLRTIFRGDSNR